MSAVKQLNMDALNYEFRGIPYPILPDTLYIGLSTSYIDEWGEGAIEPSDSSYNRFGITREGDSWAEEDDRFVNMFTATFSIEESSSDIIEEIFIAKGPIKGDSDILFHTRLNPSVPYYRGDDSTFIISPGTLSITWR